MLLFIGGCLKAVLSRAQDLAPRIYVVTPIHSNSITLIYSICDGNTLFDGRVPITGATAKVNVPVFSVFHSLSFLGRNASLTLFLPYEIGKLRGQVADAETLAYRSGLHLATFRFPVNLIGGPAMNFNESQKWQQEAELGVSFKLVLRTG